MKQNNRRWYDSLLIFGRMEDHLAEINCEAAKMMETLTTRIKSLESITEELKTEDKMAWVQTINNIKNHAEEIVTKGYIAM